MKNFSWKDLTEFSYERNFTFDEIPVEIIRNPLVEVEKLLFRLC